MVDWDPNFDIYALAGGFYPLVGEVERLQYQEIYKSYGMGKSAVNTPAYKIDLEGDATEIKYAQLKGNFVSFGSLEPDQLSTISSQYEDVLLSDLTTSTDAEDVMTEAAELLDTRYAASLKSQEATLLSGEGLKGRSLEEMFGAVEGMEGSGAVTGEADIRAMYSTGNTTSNPPDIAAMGAGIDVSRQRLGGRGHTFYGAPLQALNTDLRKIARKAKNENLKDREIYKLQAEKGLKHFKDSYKRFNRQIRAIKRRYIYGGGTFSNSKMSWTAVGKTSFMGRVLSDLAKTDPASEARKIAVSHAKGKASNFLTNQALNLIKHHMSFSTVDFETYTLDKRGVHVEYGPISQRPANVPREFEYFINSMNYRLRYEGFAGDYYLKQLIPDFNAESAAEARFGAFVTKELAGHGTVMEAGHTYKRNVGLMKNKLKLRPSIAVNQANKEFNNVIGKKLLPKLQKVAQQMLAKQGTTFSGMLQNRGPQELQNEGSWAIPYVSVVSFKSSAYAD